MSCLNKDRRMCIERGVRASGTPCAKVCKRKATCKCLLNNSTEDIVKRIERSIKDCQQEASHSALPIASSSSSASSSSFSTSSASSSSGIAPTPIPDHAISLKLEQADDLCRLKRLKEALSVYAECFYGHSRRPISPQRLATFVDALYETLKPSVRNLKSEKYGNHSQSGKEQLADPWSCNSCYGVLYEPVTLPCGHSYCRRCLEVELTSSNPHCHRCRSKLKRFDQPPELHSNVLVNRLVEKFWSSGLEAIRIKNDGNRLCRENKMREAADLYSKGIEKEPNDYFLWGNRSHAYLSMGLPELALKDACTAISVKPTWAKGYYRKALALNTLGRHEEAFKAFYECLALEEGHNVKLIKKELTNTLHTILNNHNASKGEENLSSQSNLFELSTSMRPSISAPALLNMKSPMMTKDAPCNGLKLPRTEPMEYEMDNYSDSEELFDFQASNVDCLNGKASCCKGNEEVNADMARLLDETLASTDRLFELALRPPEPRPIDRGLVEKDDFECPLCFRLLHQPVTTPCGHTFCRVCLDRTLDHSTDCPMCKAGLSQYLAERRDALDDFVQESIMRLLPEDAVERQRTADQELEEIAGGGAGNNEVPVFVCTMSFPTIPCPLHVFEPRYRLMIRRCMEAGTREFGMCSYVEDNGAQFADYGTMLEIRDIQYFPDGRSVVDAVGGRRFKVLDRGVRDGYHTAKVEFIRDDKLDCDSIKELKTLHDTVLGETRSWFNAMSSSLREGILKHYGAIPDVENEYWNLPNGPAWTWWIIAILPIDVSGQLKILSQTQLKRRLEAIQKMLRILNRCGS